MRVDGAAGRDDDLPVLPPEMVQLLLRTIAEVNSNQDLDEVLTSVVDRTLVLTKAENSVLLLVEGGRLVRRVARDFRGQDLPDDHSYSRTVPVEVARSGVAKILQNTTAEDLQDLGSSIINLRLLTVMCVPLCYKGNVTGVVYVDSRAATRKFQKADLALMLALADQAAIAIENARLLAASLENQRKEHQLRLAQDIQTGLLPAGPLTWPGFDIHGMSESCESIGGDYFDYVDGPDGALRIAVGDVSGHGVPAALLMTTARALLRAISPSEEDLATCVRRLNVHLERDLDPGKFMTMFVAEIDPGDRSIRYVCAGHNAPLVIRAGGEIETLEKTGMGLGIMPDAAFRCAGPVKLDPGDVLLVYTDGISEAPNRPRDQAREMFGMERLREVVLESRSGSAREITRAIQSAVARWRHGTVPDDDETMVVIKSEAGV